MYYLLEGYSCRQGVGVYLTPASIQGWHCCPCPSADTASPQPACPYGLCKRRPRLINAGSTSATACLLLACQAAAQRELAPCQGCGSQLIPWPSFQNEASERQLSKSQGQIVFGSTTQFPQCPAWLLAEESATFGRSHISVCETQTRISNPGQRY